MTKKAQQSKSRGRRRNTTAVPPIAATMVPEVLIQEQGEIRVGMSVTMADLAKKVRTDAREALLERRNEVNDELTAAKREYSHVEQQLQAAATVLVQDFGKDPAANTLAESLAAFTGEAYTVRAHGEKADLGSFQVTVDIEVLRVKDARNETQKAPYYGYSSGGHSVSKSTTAPFTVEMRALVAQLQAISVQVQEIQGRLDRVNRHLADLPNLVDRAESALVEAALTGKLRTGEDMLRTVGSVKPKSLPALTGPAHE